MLSLKYFQKKYIHHISKGLSFFGLNHLIEDTNFDFDVYLPSKGMNLQRDLCWTLQQKQSLILVILRDQVVPAITIVQIEDLTGRRDFLAKRNWQVIDGKQRLTTIISYFNNEFPILVEDKEYFFKDLPTDCQRQLMFYDLKVNVHYHYKESSKNNITDDTKISLFEDINWLGTPQDINHMKKLKQGNES